MGIVAVRHLSQQETEKLSSKNVPFLLTQKSRNMPGSSHALMMYELFGWHLYDPWNAPLQSKAGGTKLLTLSLEAVLSTCAQ